MGHICISVYVLWFIFCTYSHLEHWRDHKLKQKPLQSCLIKTNNNVMKQVWLMLFSAFSLQHSLYCCRSDNRKCNSQRKRDPRSYERYNRVSTLTTSIITRLQCLWNCVTWWDLCVVCDKHLLDTRVRRQSRRQRLTSTSVSRFFFDRFYVIENVVCWVIAFRHKYNTKLTTLTRPAVVRV